MLLCGIDEAGRGPLAGPVTAAAVVLPAGFSVERLGDSKRLTPLRRDALFDLIRAGATSWAIGWASHREIDEMNILRASHLAMLRAVRSLPVVPDLAIVDGSIAPELGVDVRAVVKADATVPEVMAASILAKVARDRWMGAYARLDPRYEFDRHKGYPTERHRELIALHGPSVVHRLSFRLYRDRYAANAGRDPGPSQRGASAALPARGEPSVRDCARL